MPTPYALSSDLVSAWPAKSLAVATYLDTALAAKADLAGATYTGAHNFTGATVTGISSGGLVLIGTPTSFSAASIVSLSAVFGTTYDNYLLILQNVASGNNGLRIRLRDAGGDLTGATYSYGSGGFDSAAGTQNFGGGAQTSFLTGYASTLRTALCLNILSPNLAQHTQITGTTEVINSGDTVYCAGVFGGVFGANTQATGISVYLAAGTFTGTAALYGYRKA